MLGSVEVDKHLEWKETIKADTNAEWKSLLLTTEGSREKY